MSSRSVIAGLFVIAAVIGGTVLVACRVKRPKTAILRPDGVGDETTLKPTAETVNYRCVDEAIPDDNATFVYPDYANGYFRDLYNLEDLVEISGKINWIKVWIRAKWMENVAPARTVIKTGGLIYEGDEITLTDSWTNYCTRYDTNPRTGTAWTWAQVNSLQAGVCLRGVLFGTPGYSWCTQVYVEVNYTPT